MELSNVFGGDSLKAADLQGNEPVVVIESVEMKKFDNGNKLVITFEGKKKCLICNKTNANRIAFAFGTNTDNWIGQEVTLFTDMVDFQGSVREAIRVRAKKPPAVARPASADMDNAPVPSRRPAAPPADMNDEIPF